jgi:hypothetical protein
MGVEIAETGRRHDVGSVVERCTTILILIDLLRLSSRFAATRVYIQIVVCFTLRPPPAHRTACTPRRIDTTIPTYLLPKPPPSYPNHHPHTQTTTLTPKPPHHTTHNAIMTEQSINIPQVLVFLVVTFLAIRWYFSKPSAQGTRPTSTRAATPRLNHRQIDDIAQMFPQLSRRDIAWDLQRNGGNAAATTERVLSGRGLDTVSSRYTSRSERGFGTDNL